MKLTILLSAIVLSAGGVFAADSIKPGQIWADDKGQHINAHGGGLMKYEGKWYWYGEHKDESGVAKTGFSVYSSDDLVNWKNEGVALSIDKDEGHFTGRGCVMERPKVIYCPRTGRFSMFFHLELKKYWYKAALVGIAVADKPTGPFKFARCLRPNACRWPQNVDSKYLTPASLKKIRAEEVEGCGGPDEQIRKSQPYVWDYEGGQMSRDMTLFVDDNGVAYHIYASEGNSTIQIAELDDSYLDYTGRYWRVAPGEWTEAPAMFKRKGEYFLIGSGCTGWDPNEARVYRAKNITGPWTRVGNPCRGVNPQTGLGPEKTWGGQSTYVIEIDRKSDNYIAMFDEWRPKNLGDSRYYWLPITFDDKGNPEIMWKDEWKPTIK